MIGVQVVAVWLGAIGLVTFCISLAFWLTGHASFSDAGAAMSIGLVAIAVSGLVFWFVEKNNR